MFGIGVPVGIAPVAPTAVAAGAPAILLVSGRGRRGGRVGTLVPELEAT
jgi:hypothetical protein